MFDAIICFTDNTKKIIHNVSNYLWGEAEEAVTVEINNASRMFFNMSQVKFIGMKDDIETLMESEEKQDIYD